VVREGPRDGRSEGLSDRRTVADPKDCYHGTSGSPHHIECFAPLLLPFNSSFNLSQIGFLPYFTEAFALNFEWIRGHHIREDALVQGFASCSQEKAMSSPSYGFHSRTSCEIYAMRLFLDFNGWNYSGEWTTKIFGRNAMTSSIAQVESTRSTRTPELANDVSHPSCKLFLQPGTYCSSRSMTSAKTFRASFAP
jgi:hypothetical protein